VTQIGKIGVTLQCGVCGRTLLLGEQVEEFTNGVRRVSVCTLCLSEATVRGWLRAGAPAPPPIEEDAQEPGEKRGWLRKRRGPATVVQPEPEPDRSVPVPAARALERGVDAFNASAYRRTVASIAKSLGVPRASVVVLSGNRPDAIVTVAWEISWYQYRVTPDSGQPVRLAERGHDPGELESMFGEWNTHLVEDGRLVPDIARV
jgi:hypothetical protein